MIIFLDFEASSLGKHGFPIEVGWAAEDGSTASHLIRPAPGWEEWSAEAEAIHGITRQQLQASGVPHDAVARHMVEALSGHDLYASAPSWDGHWLSLLLRAAGFTRHTLRLRDTEDVQSQAAAAFLDATDPPKQQRDAAVKAALDAARQALNGLAPAHRALDDARRELHLWQEVRRQAERLAKGTGA